MRMKSFAEWFDRWYVLAMCMVAVIVIWLQYHNDFGHLVFYQDYARIIRSGLDYRAALFGPHTCPMWGYAIPVMFTDSKLLLLLFQNILGIFSAWFFIRTLSKRKKLPEFIHVRIFKIMLILSLPLYAFNSMLGPQSIAANLLLLSFSLLIAREKSARLSLRKIVLSGVLYGMMLNFRSDFCLLPFALVFIAILATRFRAAILLRGVVWLCCIYTMLIPWGIYTKLTTGDYLFTSTNSGHVLFNGLGSRPDNKWGITQNDNDPIMMKIVDDNCGSDAQTCGHNGNVFLKKKWFDLVSEDPAEYLRGCKYSLIHMLVGGVYAGDFDPEFGRRIKTLLRQKSLRNIIADDPFIWLNYLNARVALNLISDMTGRLVVFLAFFSFPFSLFVAIKKRNLFVLLMCSAIAHQWAINIFVSNMRSYMSSVYPFYLAIIIYGSVFYIRPNRNCCE